MHIFLTSSPCIPNADRALLNPVNEFVERMRAALPEHPEVLFVCSHPDSYELTDRFARDMYDAFGEAEMPFGGYTVLDSRTEDRAAELVKRSDFIILAGGHVPTQGESIDLNYQRWLAGLALTETMLLPHYQQVKDSMLDGKRLFEDITFADSMGYTFYAMVDGTYLYVQQGKQTMMGECWQIRNGVIKQVCEAGKQLAL